MKLNKRLFVFVSVLFASLPPASAGTLKAGDADPNSPAVAQLQNAKQKCVNVCRARYRACRSANQIPAFECLSVYQDCARWTCNGMVD